jgi:hypothetical protein
MTRVNTINPQNSWFRSEDYDNFIETQIKEILKFNSQSTECCKIELRKKSIKKMIKEK